jgi:CDP-diacylglycerol---glycerol-3-phosphate 3-phosphatidyltransferase
LTFFHVDPNWVTFLGVGLTFMVPLEVLHDRWIRAGFWLLAAGFFDVLDGSLARQNSRKRPFGAFWDSTMDRISEAIVFGGLLLYYGQHQDMTGLLMAFVVCILSLLVSYIRARAEGLGIDCEVGILPRPGRVILLVLGFWMSLPAPALAVVGTLSLVTVLQRIYHVWHSVRRVNGR